MDNAAPRPHTPSLLPACIVAASLIVSALIIAHRPPPPAPVVAPASTPSARPVTMPPIAQASAQQQFRAQVLATPALHTFVYNKQTYTLTDVHVKQVIYSAKDDNFTITYDWVWLPAMPHGGPQSDYSVLSNDGYGHYYGGAVLSPVMGGSGQNADITIR